MEERYEAVKELGAGNLGVARLVRDKSSKELIVVKYIERGKKMDENVQREIINHQSLRHPNIIRFKEHWRVLLKGDDDEKLDHLMASTEAWMNIFCNRTVDYLVALYKS